MRRVISTIAVSALIAVIASPSATAADDIFSDFDALASFAANCQDGDTATLTGDIGDGAGVLDVGCELTLDIAGHMLHTSQVAVGSGSTLTVTDSGTGGQL